MHFCRRYPVFRRGTCRGRARFSPAADCGAAPGRLLWGHGRRHPALNAIERGRPARPPSSCCRWSTTSCAGWRRRSWPRRSRARRCRPTALVHEAYLRLVGARATSRPVGRPRSLLRRRRRGHAPHPGGQCPPQTQPQARRRTGRARTSTRLELAASRILEDLLALDEALTRLAAKDPMKAELVKLRFFAGLTIEAGRETARHLPRARRIATGPMPAPGCTRRFGRPRQPRADHLALGK